VEADDLYHTAGQKGQATQGGPKLLGRRPRGRRKKREPGRGHDDKDRPAIIAWVSRQGAVVIQATRDFTVQTVQKAADIAVQAGSRLYTDSASSYRALKGYVHEYVNHTQKEYARGDVHENRAECLFSLLKPYLRVFRGLLLEGWTIGCIRTSQTRAGLSTGMGQHTATVFDAIGQYVERACAGCTSPREEGAYGD
jgi:hypothetical protein